MAISVFIYTGRLKPKRVIIHLIPILTWGGLRGGISIALALSLSRGKYRDIFNQVFDAHRQLLDAGKAIDIVTYKIDCQHIGSCKLVTAPSL